MRRARKKQNRQGVRRAIIDDDTVEGFAMLTAFVVCNGRSDLWHLPKRQAMGHLFLPELTLCGVKPYRQGAEVRRSWDGFSSVRVCASCEAMAKDF